MENIFSMKTCLIKQPAGIGDILFCQKIAKTIQEETDYEKIIWPVSSQYAYLSQYLIENGIEYPLETEDFLHKEIYNSGNLYMIQTDNLLFVPLHTCDRIEQKCKCHNDHRAHGHMKYNFCNIEYTNWKDYFNINRNLVREDALIQRLKLNINEPYNVINNHAGTYPNYDTSDIIPNNNYRNVYMEFIDGVNIFDWMGIFENAKEIHTMECGVYYILEKMNLNDVFIYTKYKNQNDNFSYMKDHCNQKWRYIN